MPYRAPNADRKPKQGATRKLSAKQLQENKEQLLPLTAAENVANGATTKATKKAGARTAAVHPSNEDWPGIDDEEVNGTRAKKGRQKGTSKKPPPAHAR